jgi:hypothetical protein
MPRGCLNIEPPSLSPGDRRSRSLSTPDPTDGWRYVRTSDVFTVRDVIDRLLAVEALQPYVTGKVNDMPPVPADLSDKLKADWPRWTEMATKVRDGAVSPILAADLETFGIVTELLFAKAIRRPCAPSSGRLRAARPASPSPTISPSVSTAPAPPISTTRAKPSRSTAVRSSNSIRREEAELS